MRILTRLTLLVVAILFLLVSASAQTPVPIPVTGNLGSITGAPQPDAYVQIQLMNCSGGNPQITGFQGIVASSYRFVADTNGNINGTAWPNDLIDCAGTTGATVYSRTIVSDDVPVGQAQCYQIVHTQGTWNLQTQQPVTCQGTPPNPQDVQYANINATGNISAGSFTLHAADIDLGLGYTPLNPANNLSDVANKAMALTNLGGLAYGPSVVNAAAYGNSVDAALAACPSTGQCDIILPAGTYTKNTNCVTRSSTAFIGAAEPYFDNPSAPTQLVGGTIIEPGLNFCGADNISVLNLGSDDGPAYVAAGGVATNGITFEGVTGTSPSDPLVKKPTLINVIALGSGNNAQFHAILVEHTVGAYLSNLTSALDTHCFAFKSDQLKAVGLTGIGCHSDDVVVKSDNYTSVGDVTISKVNLQSLTPNDSQNGVVIDSEATSGTNTTAKIHVSDVQMTGMTTGLNFLANGNVGDGAVNTVTVENLTVYATYLGNGAAAPTCLGSSTTSGQSFRWIKISNVTCVNATNTGGFSPTEVYTPMYESQINNWTTVGEVNAADLSGTIQVNGWFDVGNGAPGPTFEAIGSNTNIHVFNYWSVRPGNTPSTTDGSGAVIYVTPDAATLAIDGSGNTHINSATFINSGAVIQTSNNLMQTTSTAPTGSCTTPSGYIPVTQNGVTLHIATCP